MPCLKERKETMPCSSYPAAPVPPPSLPLLQATEKTVSPALPRAVRNCALRNPLKNRICRCFISCHANIKKMGARAVEPTNSPKHALRTCRARWLWPKGTYNRWVPMAGGLAIAGGGGP